jgi:hypothetical protein
VLRLRGDERGLGWGNERVILKVWRSLDLMGWRFGGGEIAGRSASDGRWRPWAAEATAGLIFALAIVIVMVRGEERED